MTNITSFQWEGRYPFPSAAVLDALVQSSGDVMREISLPWVDLRTTVNSAANVSAGQLVCPLRDVPGKVQKTSITGSVQSVQHRICVYATRELKEVDL